MTENSKEASKRSKMDTERRQIEVYTYLRREEMNIPEGMENGRRERNN